MHGPLSLSNGQMQRKRLRLLQSRTATSCQRRENKSKEYETILKGLVIALFFVLLSALTLPRGTEETAPKPPEKGKKRERTYREKCLILEQFKNSEDNGGQESIRAESVSNVSDE